MRWAWLAKCSTAILAIGLLGSCDQGPAVAPPVVPFAPLVDPSVVDPDNPTKIFRVDFAHVEADFPLSRADQMKLTPENVTALSQEQIDQIYGRLTAGTVPDGFYRSDLFFTSGDSIRDRLEEIVGGIRGRVTGQIMDGLMLAVGSLWKG